ncbi:hypothetical protein CLOSS21_01949 [Clostridium sp. SS2/1]|nr:hypothetical protein CLOSS21_01949 [Clostridium sp. SS2/1]
MFFSFLRNSSPTCRGRRILAIFLLKYLPLEYYYVKKGTA